MTGLQTQQSASHYRSHQKLIHRSTPKGSTKRENQLQQNSRQLELVPHVDGCSGQNIYVKHAPLARNLWITGNALSSIIVSCIRRVLLIFLYFLLVLWGFLQFLWRCNPFYLKGLPGFRNRGPSRGCEKYVESGGMMKEISMECRPHALVLLSSFDLQVLKSIGDVCFMSSARVYAGSEEIKCGRDVVFNNLIEMIIVPLIQGAFNCGLKYFTLVEGGGILQHLRMRISRLNELLLASGLVASEVDECNKKQYCSSQGEQAVCSEVGSCSSRMLCHFGIFSHGAFTLKVQREYETFKPKHILEDETDAWFEDNDVLFFRILCSCAAQFDLLWLCRNYQNIHLPYIFRETISDRTQENNEENSCSRMGSNRCRNFIGSEEGTTSDTIDNVSLCRAENFASNETENTFSFSKENNRFESENVTFLHHQLVKQNPERVLQRVGDVPFLDSGGTYVLPSEVDIRAHDIFQKLTCSRASICRHFDVYDSECAKDIIFPLPGVVMTYEIPLFRLTCNFCSCMWKSGKYMLKRLLLLLSRRFINMRNLFYDYCVKFYLGNKKCAEKDLVILKAMKEQELTPYNGIENDLLQHLRQVFYLWKSFLKQIHVRTCEVLSPFPFLHAFGPSQISPWLLAEAELFSSDLISRQCNTRKSNESSVKCWLPVDGEKGSEVLKERDLTQKSNWILNFCKSILNYCYQVMDLCNQHLTYCNPIWKCLSFIGNILDLIWNFLFGPIIEQKSADTALYEALSAFRVRELRFGR